MKRIAIFIAIALLIPGIAFSMSWWSDECYVTTDKAGTKCFNLEKIYGYLNFCPSTTTNPQYNWCVARVVRDVAGDCCFGMHLKPWNDTQCRSNYVYTSGQMQTCLTTYVYDLNNDICMARDVYNGICY